jgi:hypothetical protein
VIFPEDHGERETDERLRLFLGRSLGVYGVRAPLSAYLCQLRAPPAPE